MWSHTHVDMVRIEHIWPEHFRIGIEDLRLLYSCFQDFVHSQILTRGDPYFERGLTFQPTSVSDLSLRLTLSTLKATLRRGLARVAQITHRCEIS